ncbi:MAG: PilZ domain-containing protein [Oscillospiraceae bacterium]|nr:PilZ domain-containing protein [Oscillospiraceae bacterium]
MGLRSLLFPEHPPKFDNDRPQKKEEKPTDFPPLFKGMTLDVVTRDGKPLLTGRLTSYTPDGLTIERLPGWLSFETYTLGSAVTVRGYTNKMTPFNLKATIQESSRIVCKLKDLVVEPYVEQRLTFRLPVNLQASLFYQHDVHCENAEHCTLVDISTGGACIQSEFMHAEGEVLRLKFQIEDYQPMNYLGEIIRVYEEKDGYKYGFLFAQLTEDELTALTRTLYNVQVGNRREWRRSDAGHW